MIVRDVIERIIEYSDVPFKLEETCDILAAGSYDNEVKGIVTTYMATADVIRCSIKLGANMIITHEPTFFTSHDTTDWLLGDPIYSAKMDSIISGGISIWRYHDYMHLKRPDPVYMGLLMKLGWECYAVQAKKAEIHGNPLDSFSADNFAYYYDIPPITLTALAEEVRKKLAMDTIRIIGRPNMLCKRIGILVGGGSLGFGNDELPAQIMKKHDINVMICGEIIEWTLCAYVNDAQQLGFDRAMIVAGHERTEEWGMEYMAQWLPEILNNNVPVRFVDAKEPFSYVYLSLFGG